MAAILYKMVYCYVHLSSVVFLNDFHYLCVCDPTKITNNFHLIHVLKSKMASNFKMAAIFTLKGYAAIIRYVVHIIVTLFLVIFTTYACGIPLRQL